MVVRILARRFSSVSWYFPLSVGSSRGRSFPRIVFCCSTGASGWHEEFEFSDDSGELSDFEDFDYV
jgi:hypothetical protein